MTKAQFWDADRDTVSTSLNAKEPESRKIQCEKMQVPVTTTLFSMYINCFLGPEMKGSLRTQTSQLVHWITFTTDHCKHHQAPYYRQGHPSLPCPNLLHQSVQISKSQRIKLEILTGINILQHFMPLICLHMLSTKELSKAATFLSNILLQN